MNPLIQADDITVVTAPDFAEPRGGAVLAILHGKDFDSKPIMEELRRNWPIDDPLVVYLQPVTNGAELARAHAIAGGATSLIVAYESGNELLTIMAGAQCIDFGIVFCNDAVSDEVLNAIRYAGLTATSDPEVAVEHAHDDAFGPN